MNPVQRKLQMQIYSTFSTSCKSKLREFFMTSNPGNFQSQGNYARQLLPQGHIQQGLMQQNQIPKNIMQPNLHPQNQIHMPTKDMYNAGQFNKHMINAQQCYQKRPEAKKIQQPKYQRQPVQPVFPQGPQMIPHSGICNRQGENPNSYIENAILGLSKHKDYLSSFCKEGINDFMKKAFDKSIQLLGCFENEISRVLFFNKSKDEPRYCLLVPGETISIKFGEGRHNKFGCFYIHNMDKYPEENIDLNVGSCRHKHHEKDKCLYLFSYYAPRNEITLSYESKEIKFLVLVLFPLVHKTLKELSTVISHKFISNFKVQHSCENITDIKSILEGCIICDFCKKLLDTTTTTALDELENLDIIYKSKHEIPMSYEDTEVYEYFDYNCPMYNDASEYLDQVQGV